MFLQFAVGMLAIVWMLAIGYTFGRFVYPKPYKNFHETSINEVFFLTIFGGYYLIGTVGIICAMIVMFWGARELGTWILSNLR